MNIIRMRIIIVLVSMLIASCAPKSHETESKTEPAESIHEEVQEPFWEGYNTYAENKKAHIHTRVKTLREHDGGYIVWVFYEWVDSTKIPEGSKNISSTAICYCIDYDFARIGILSSHDYLESGQAINNKSYEEPLWQYIVPETEGDNVSQATMRILDKQYPYNKAANKIYIDTE